MHYVMPCVMLPCDNNSKCYFHAIFLSLTLVLFLLYPFTHLNRNIFNNISVSFCQLTASSQSLEQWVNENIQLPQLCFQLPQSLLSQEFSWTFICGAQPLIKTSASCIWALWMPGYPMRHTARVQFKQTWSKLTALQLCWIQNKLQHF